MVRFFCVSLLFSALLISGCADKVAPASGASASSQVLQGIIPGTVAENAMVTWRVEPSEETQLRYLNMFSPVGMFDVDSSRFALTGLDSALHHEFDAPDRDFGGFTVLDEELFSIEAEDNFFCVTCPGSPGYDKVVYLSAVIDLPAEMEAGYTLYYSGSVITKVFINRALVLTYDSREHLEGDQVAASGVFELREGKNLLTLKMVIPDGEKAVSRLFLRGEPGGKNFKMVRVTM